MTDNEIIKALECCKTITVFDCDMCPYKGIGKGLVGCANLLIGDALDLINRQKAVIEDKTEKLRKVLPIVAELKAEAIKEFAEGLKGKAEFTTIAGYINYSRLIDNLVKEMTEGKDE